MEINLKGMGDFLRGLTKTELYDIVTDENNVKKVIEGINNVDTDAVANFVSVCSKSLKSFVDNMETEDIIDYRLFGNEKVVRSLETLTSVDNEALEKDIITTTSNIIHTLCQDDIDYYYTLKHIMDNFKPNRILDSILIHNVFPAVVEEIFTLVMNNISKAPDRKIEWYESASHLHHFYSPNELLQRRRFNEIFNYKPSVIELINNIKGVNNILKNLPYDSLTEKLLMYLQKSNNREFLINKLIDGFKVYFPDLDEYKYTYGKLLFQIFEERSV